MSHLLRELSVSPPSRRPGFNPALAALLCKRSAASYAHEPGGEIIECEATRTRVICERVPISNLQTKALVVTFRGTANIRNWVTDLNLLKTGYPVVDFGGCRVHLGFWLSWVSVRHDVRKWIEWNDPEAPVYFTGHSLGGALATLAAHWFHLEFSEIPTTYTFGQPRVGNGFFAAALDIVLRPFTFRIVHANDIVPRVPLLLGGFRHAGQEVFYGPADSGPCLNPTIAQKLPFDIRNACRELTRGKLALLDDHHVNTYLALFE
jgi:hypothetical protein